jgi:hypothetical protein
MAASGVLVTYWGAAAAARVGLEAQRFNAHEFSAFSRIITNFTNFTHWSLASSTNCATLEPRARLLEGVRPDREVIRRRRVED